MEFIIYQSVEILNINIFSIYKYNDFESSSAFILTNAISVEKNGKTWYWLGVFHKSCHDFKRWNGEGFVTLPTIFGKFI
jgi:hypothetical protein